MKIEGQVLASDHVSAAEQMVMETKDTMEVAESYLIPSISSFF